MTPNQRTVIIVEDEADAAEMFAEMMRVSGYRVVKIFRSASAIGIISAEKPDVVILDVMMPDVSGLEFCVLCVVSQVCKISLWFWFQQKACPLILKWEWMPVHRAT